MAAALLTAWSFVVPIFEGPDEFLVTTMAACTVWGMVRIVRHGFTWKRGVMTAIALAAAWLTKINALCLVPAFAVVILTAPAPGPAPWRTRLARLSVWGVTLALVAPRMNALRPASATTVTRAGTRQDSRPIAIINAIAGAGCHPRVSSERADDLEAFAQVPTRHANGEWLADVRIAVEDAQFVIFDLEGARPSSPSSPSPASAPPLAGESRDVHGVKVVTLDSRDITLPFSWLSDGRPGRSI